MTAGAAFVVLPGDISIAYSYLDGAAFQRIVAGITSSFEVFVRVQSFSSPRLDDS